MWLDQIELLILIGCSVGIGAIVVYMFDVIDALDRMDMFDVFEDQECFVDGCDCGGYYMSWDEHQKQIQQQNKGANK